MNGISSVRTMNFQGATTEPNETPCKTENLHTNIQNIEDSADFSTKKEYDGPKIGFFRAAFSRLTDEQREAINRTGKLPENVKIMRSEYGYLLGNNLFNILSGTRTVPAGYELSKGILGFTKIVEKDTEGLFIRK